MLSTLIKELEFFLDSESEVNYGEVDLAPLLFQDDINRMAVAVTDAQDGIDRLENLAESKLLDFHGDKSVFLVVGSKKDKDHIISELRISPLTLYNKPLKQVKGTISQ